MRSLSPLHEKLNCTWNRGHLQRGAAVLGVYCERGALHKLQVSAISTVNICAITSFCLFNQKNVTIEVVSI
jgi:hypothetical protein